MRYRSYLFTNQGLFLVFVSAGKGSEETMTGARIYHMLDAENPQFELDNSGNLKIQSSPNFEFIFSQQTGFLLDISNVSLRQDFEINLQNRGGVELDSPKTWMIDSGWNIGGAPHQDPTNLSVIRGSNGYKCSVMNSEIFRYYGTGEVAPKFLSTKEFEDQNLCP
jgi:hypothetical protein